MELWPVWLCDWWLLTGYTFMYDVELYDCAWLLTGYTLMYSKPWNILTTPSVLKRINKRINLERDMIPSRTIYVDTTYINLGGVTSFLRLILFETERAHHYDCGHVWLLTGYTLMYAEPWNILHYIIMTLLPNATKMHVAHITNTQ